MPAYKKDGYGGDDRGGVRYRGRGRGGFGRAGRDSGGGRGYGRGGGSYDHDRYKWSDRGGRHEGSGGYRDRGYGQSRFRDGPGSRNQGGSWNRGSGSGSGHMERGRSADLLRPLSHLSGKESKIAMDILNAVLASSQNSSGGISRNNWYDGPPRKMRRMDWDGVRSPPMHKYPQRGYRRKYKGYRSISGYAKGPLDYRKMTEIQLREMEVARLEMPQPAKKERKDSEKKILATEEKQEVKEGEQEKATAEENSPPADADRKQSDSADEFEREIDPDDAEKMDADIDVEELESDDKLLKPEDDKQLKPEDEKLLKSDDDKQPKSEGDKQLKLEDKQLKPEDEELKSEDKKQLKPEDKKQLKPEDKKQLTQEDNSKLTEEDESQEDTSVIIPRATLMCHMCDMTKFPNTKAYLSHLESKNHEMMARAFHSRNNAVIDVLIADSKLVSKQKPKSKIGYPRCMKCNCYMSSSIRQHCQTTEHTLVSRYSRVRCCSNSYNRMILEEHRLSLRHLKNQWDIEQETQKIAQKEEEEEKKRLETEPSFHEEVYRFKKSNECEEELTPATLPLYDPDKPIGVNFLYKEKEYRCDLCRSHLRNPEHAEYHFRCIDHYYTLCRNLTEEEEKKELERKKLEEANKEQDESKSKENNGDENDNCEDMNNMETVDEALEDADMDTHVQVSADGGAATEEGASSADIEESLERSADNEEHYEENKKKNVGSENNQEEMDDEDDMALNTKDDLGDDEDEVMDEEGLDYEPGVGV